MVSGKGKEKVPDGGKGKRKWSGKADDDKTGRKRSNRGVVKFFDDEAYQVDEDEDSSSDDSFFDDLEEEFPFDLNNNDKTGKKVPIPPFIPKEEEMSEEELERMLGERYKPGSGYVTYAEDGYEQTSSDIFVPSSKDPSIWKVKCVVGRERYSALCLMQKFADLDYLGTKLQIISACALDHIKGFIVIEADKQQDIYEACKGLSSIYASKVTAVPDKELPRLLSVKSKSSAITEGMFARVKNGKYRGDLAEVVAVNNDKKKVTVKLIPRIDLKAMAEKFGGGIPTKRTAIPAQRLICSSELEEFRPLIQSRRDRETNLMFEVLDGMMLKDGYLYKKISMDSLSFWGITPTEDELLKFEPSKKDESTDVQWLSQLFGEKKKKEKEVKASNKSGKGGEKSEGSSSAFIGNNFEVHDLVFFGRKDFGVVIGLEKDDTVKIIKESPEGPSVVNVKPSEVKSATFDKKLFSVLDRNSNTLTVNDNVRVLDGPLKDKQGVIKKIYKGILFLCDESEQENDGYTCVKAQLCEKVNHSGDALNEQDSEHVPSCFADLTSSPKTPLSPDKSLQERDSKTNFKRDDGTFSVGQTLRIRVGPLKGYICRVLAVRRTDVTVKLDSQHRILTVKSEHLTEVRGRNTVTAQGEESVKPFDFLGAQDGASGWMNGADAGGSTERSSWSTFPSSSSSLWKGSGSGDPADNDAKKGTEDSWQIKETPADNSSWGAAAAAANKSESGQADGWGKPAEPQGDSSGGWGKPVEPQEDSSGGWGKSVEAKEDSSGGWGKPVEPKEDSSGGWGKPVKPQEDSSGGWGKPVKPQEDSSGGWGKPVGPQEDSAGGWGKPVKPQEDSSGGWGKPVEPQPESGAWGNAGGASSQAYVESGGWAISTDNGDSQTGGWNKPKSVGADSGSAWGKSEGTSSWGKKDDATQETSWGRSNTFDGGRDSGGRRGGRGRGRGGRDNYGWGRSFDQGQSGSWNKGQSGGFGDGGKTSSWSSDQGGGWGSKSNEDKDGQRSGLTDSGKNSSWGSDSAGGWGNSTANEGGKSGGWGNANATGKDEEPSWNQNAKKDGGGSEWGAGAGILGKEPKPNEDNKSSWNSATTSSSGWGNNKASEESGGWNKKSGDGGNDGSSSSWKGNWSKSESGGNQDTGWGSKSSWSSGGGFGGGNNQDDTSGDGGGGWRGGRGGRGGDRGGWSSGGAFGGGNNQDDTSGDGGGGGGWRGGRGGRGGDRGGFRGRGRSDRGGFGGRDGSGRGRFGGRGSDGGGYGGGGRGEGFHGRGGFRGRGRGDWNNREDNSNNDGGGWKNSSGGGSSWNSSGGGGNSWSNSGGGGSSWNNSGGDNNRGSSWSRPKDNTSTGGWGSPSKDAGGSGGWGSSSKDAGGSGGWGSSNASASKDAGGAGGAGDWGSSNASDKDAGGSGGWGSANALEKKDAGGSGGWGSSNASDKKDAGGSGGWGSSNASDKKDAGGSGGWGSSDASDKKGAGGSGGWGPSDASANKDAGGSGGWGSGGSGKGGW